MAKRGKQKQKQPKGKTQATKATKAAAQASDTPSTEQAADDQAPVATAEAEAVVAGEIEAARVEAGQDADASAQEPSAEGGPIDEPAAADAAEWAPEAEEARAVAEGEGAEAEDAEAPAARTFPRVPSRRRHEQVSPFLVLADYEQRSLVHVAGLPEQLDAPGLWRGVAYRVGSRRLASGFDEVLEILPMPVITHVPGSQPWMLGVANIRGTLLPVVDLKQFLEGERTVLQEKQRVLVVHQPGGDVAVTIDELYGQRGFVDAQRVDAAPIADGRYAYFVDRAYRMNDQDWGVFSLDRLARTPEFRQATA